jgi:hypothetical protein
MILKASKPDKQISKQHQQQTNFNFGFKIVCENGF